MKVYLLNLCFCSNNKLQVPEWISRLEGIFCWHKVCTLGFPGVLVVKNPPSNSGDLRDMDSIPGLGRSPGGGHVNPLQYSCQKNPMDRAAWQATVHSISKSWTWLKQLSMHTNIYIRWGKSWKFTSCCHSRTQDDGSSATLTMWFPRCLWAFISN